MISTILIWLYIFMLTTVFGHLMFRVCTGLIKTKTVYNPTFAELSIFGLLGIGTLLCYFSIFFKIGLLSNILILSIVLIHFILQPRSIILYYNSQIQEFNKYPIIARLLVVLYLIMILFAAQAYPKVYDTGLYHAQFIQWISSFKTIPGLGNLHGRFAYNNHSFLLESFFSLSFLKLGYFHLVNSFLLLVLSVSMILSLQKLIHSDWIKSFLYFGLLILFQIFYLVFASSPTPDIFSTVGIWFISITFLKRLSSNYNNKIYWIILIFIAFFLVTVKLYSLPIVLIAFLYLIEPGSNFLRKLVLITCIGLIVFIPFFIRNYLISGYLVYPYPLIDFFNPDWKIPLPYVQEMKSVIATFAQCRDWQVRQFNEWLPIWFSNLSTGFKLISVFILLSPLLIVLIILLRRSILHFFQSEFKILVICFLAIIFWYFSAPNYRFVYGFLFIYLLIIAMILLHYLFYEFGLIHFFERHNKNLLKIYYVRIIYAVMIIFPFIFFLNCDFSEIRKSVVFPVKYKSASLKTITINNLKVNIPADNTFCWDACIPCSIFQNNIGITNIELRGKELKDGFRVRN